MEGRKSVAHAIQTQLISTSMNASLLKTTVSLAADEVKSTELICLVDIGNNNETSSSTLGLIKKAVIQLAETTLAPEVDFITLISFDVNGKFLNRFSVKALLDQESNERKQFDALSIGKTGTRLLAGFEGIPSDLFLHSENNTVITLLTAGMPMKEEPLGSVFNILLDKFYDLPRIIAIQFNNEYKSNLLDTLMVHSESGLSSAIHIMDEQAIEKSLDSITPYIKPQKTFVASVAVSLPDTTQTFNLGEIQAGNNYDRFVTYTHREGDTSFAAKVTFNYGSQTETETFNFEIGKKEVDRKEDPTSDADKAPEKQVAATPPTPKKVTPHPNNFFEELGHLRTLKQFEQQASAETQPPTLTYGNT